MNLTEAAMFLGLKSTYAIGIFKYTLLLFIERVKKENDVFRLNFVQNIVIIGIASYSISLTKLHHESLLLLKNI